MRNKIIGLGLSLLGVTGCTGEGFAWLSNNDIELYENASGAVYKARLAGPSINDTLYSIQGLDAPLFTINTESGEIQFKQSPDYENPQDYNRDNSYDVTVVATSSISGEQHSTIDVSLTVKDASDLIATKLFPLPNSYIESNANGIVPLTVLIKDLDAPVFYPDDWQIFDPNITRFFHYLRPSRQFKANFSDDTFSPYLDPKRYGSSDTEIIRDYYVRKFVLPFEAPMLFHYGYAVNPVEKITITYFSTGEEQAPPIELEWTLSDRLSGLGANAIDQPQQIALSNAAIYFASGNELWRTSRDGSQLTKIYSAENSTIDKLAVLNERVFLLLHDNSPQRWRLVEVSNNELVDIYEMEGLSAQMLGAEYDTEILYTDSGYTAAFMPKEICQEKSEGVIESAMYRFNSLGLIADTTLLTNLKDVLFKCQNGHLIGSNSTHSLEYGSPRMSYNAIENTLYYWGRRYSEDQINGLVITANRTSVAVGSEYSLDASVENFSDFQHFSRSFNERKSIYIDNGGLYVANGHIVDTATLISNENYHLQSYAVDVSSDLIYGVGYWDDTQIPTLSVHHLYSGAASYVPLTPITN